jgi:hypothetical protein
MRSGEHERELHAAVAQFLRLALRAPTTWTTFPAGGGGLERGRMLARLGLRPGWPDILVVHSAPTRSAGRSTTCRPRWRVRACRSRRPWVSDAVTVATSKTATTIIDDGGTP